jgi:hypothetical protein
MAMLRTVLGLNITISILVRTLESGKIRMVIRPIKPVASVEVGFFSCRPVLLPNLPRSRPLLLRPLAVDVRRVPMRFGIVVPPLVASPAGNGWNFCNPSRVARSWKRMPAIKLPTTNFPTNAFPAIRSIAALQSSIIIAIVHLVRMIYGDEMREQRRVDNVWTFCNNKIWERWRPANKLEKQNFQTNVGSAIRVHVE